MVEEILPNLHRVVLPLTGNPLRSINSYVFTSSDRSLVVDTGMNREECRVALEGGLDEIGVDLERTDFIATHYHADHHGLTPTLLREGSRAFMGALDAKWMNCALEFWGEGEGLRDYAARSGFPRDVLRESLKNHPASKYGPTRRVDYIPLADGEIVRIGRYALRVVETPGHTNGHICLYEPEEKFLLSGDHVLGDITPNLQAWSDDEDPLGDFLDSLEKVKALDVVLCLPGHRSSIEDFGKRVGELAQHHRERANEVISILAEGGANAYDTASRMSWDIAVRSWEELPVVQRWFAVGEAIAHLRYLECRGLIQREATDDEIRYTSDGAARL